MPLVPHPLFELIMLYNVDGKMTDLKQSIGPKETHPTSSQEGWDLPIYSYANFQ